MDIKEFAASLNGREYGYPQFSDEELETARENNFVIISGASDDLVEFNGAIRDEGDCYDGGKIFFEAVSDGRVVNSNTNNPNVCSFNAKWCEEKDENGGTIQWSYDVPFAHEDFLIYEDGEIYCRGFVFCLDNMPKGKMSDSDKLKAIMEEVAAVQSEDESKGYVGDYDDFQLFYERIGDILGIEDN